MKAQVFMGKNKISYIERPISKPGLKELIVKVKYCGICGTDIHCYQSGLLVPKGTVLGHEITGTIFEVGEEIKNFFKDQRVVINPIPRCGKCYWCKKGQYVLCTEGLKNEIGITQENDGGFAEFVKVKYPDEMLHVLSDNISFKDAALVEPLATSLHAVRMSRDISGANILVLGAGMIGMGIISFLKISNAGMIFVSEISEEKRRLAKSMGADFVFDPSINENNINYKLMELTDKIGVDIVFECTGQKSAFQCAIDSTKKGGQIIIVGFGNKKIPLNLLEIILKEIELKAILGYYDEFKLVLEYLGKKRIRTDLLINDIISLKDLEGQGFLRLINSADLVKILVEP